MATIQTRFSGNEFWNDILYQISPGGTAPTVTTTSLNMNGNTTATIHGDVISQGSSVLTAYGFVYSHTNTNPTLSDSVLTIGTSSFTGAYNGTTGGLTFPNTYYFAAYATNSVGTSYGSVLSGMVQICFAAGTLITMADGSKKNIEDVTYEDELLVWDFDKGIFSKSKPVWIAEPFDAWYYGCLRFGRGTELKTVADGRGHCIFNMDKGMFTYSMCEDTPYGTTTFTDDNKETFLVDKSTIRENTRFYNIMTAKHINMFANGILTSSGLNNIYPIAEMKFVKNYKALKDRKEFDVSKELFDGLRLAEQPSYYNAVDIRVKINNMIGRQLKIY